MDAVIHARLSLDTTRLSSTEEPKVVLAEEMRLEDAGRRVARRGSPVYEGRPADTKVWLVLFEGDWQVTGPPPDPEHPITPESPSHGCVYVIIDVNQGGQGEIGTTECSP